MATTKIEDLSSTKKKITITVPKSDLKGFLNRAYQKVSQSAKINGFRQGKIPQNILDQQYGPQIEYECVNFIVSDTYSKVLSENQLIPLLEPQFDVTPLDREKDYSFHVEVEVRPTIELKDYSKLKLKKQKTEITDKEVEQELTRLQESMAQLSPADEGATLSAGLVATIDFDGTMDGKTFDGGSAKDYMFEFGKGQLLKEFEDNISGMKANEQKDIEITFPDDYFEKSLAGKKASYAISLKNLHKKNLPTLDDELAKDVGKNNLDEVKEELKKSLGQRKESEFRQSYIEQIKEQIAKQYNFEIPQGVIEAESKRTQREAKEIEEQLRVEFVLEEIAKKEDLKITTQDLEQRLNMLSRMYGQPAAEIQKIYQKNNMMGMLATQIVLDKTMDLLIEKADSK